MKGNPETTFGRREYQHVVFNHALGIERLLAEHNCSPWQLVRIVPYNQFESVLVLERECVDAK